MISRLLAAVLLITAMALAQTPPPRAPAGPGDQGGGFARHRGPGGMGRWWKNTELVQQLGLTDPQVQNIEKIFQDHRLRLIDLKANLERAEAGLEPLIESDNPDEKAVLAQIDKVAAQRAELEKANAQMLFAIRRVLRPEQWKKLQSLRAQGAARWNVPAAPPQPRGPMGPPPPGDE